MTKVFESLRLPDQWRYDFRPYPHGCHWPHAVVNLLATVVVKINDLLIDSVDVRHTPRLALSKHNQGKNRRALILTMRGKQKRIPIALGDKNLILGDDWICLDDAGGPLRLVNALVSVIQSFWMFNDIEGVAAPKPTAARNLTGV